MKLLMCPTCLDIFNLTLETKTCVCGQSYGKYVNDLDVEISEIAIPIAFSSTSFDEALYRQRIENKYAKDDTCCKGQEFTAFFIPEWAKSIRRI